MRKSITFFALACMAYLPTNAQIVFQDDFESTTGTALPSGWTQTNVGAGIWKSGTNTTLESTDFPIEAHTRMLGFNDDAGGNTQLNTNQLLKTPSINLTSVTNPYLAFDMYYFAGTYQNITESFKVEVSTNGGTNWTVLQTMTGNTVSAWETRYLNLSAYAGMPNVMIGFRYSDNSGWVFGTAIDNIKVFTPSPTDIFLTSVTPVPGSPVGYGLSGGTIPVGGTVFNNGSTAITSFTVTYTVNGGTPVVTPISSVNIAPFTSYTFTATAANLPATPGVYPVDMWVTLTGDADATNDSAATTVGAASFMPDKKLVFEEATGTWCGWCPRGAVWMDSISEIHGNDLTLVAVHNNDPMESFNSSTGAYDTKIGTYVGGYPSMVVDRRFETDPGNTFAAYNAQSNYFGFADVTIGTVTTGANTVSVPVTIKPAIPLSGDYRLALVITEEGVKGTASGYNQANYYSSTSQNQDLIGDGVNWKNLANPVPAANMIYDFVARYISNANGDAGILPTSMAAGTDYSHTYAGVSTAGMGAMSHLRVSVLLIRGSDGVILNSQNTVVPTGIANVNNTISGVKLYPNPTTDHATLAFTLQNTGKANIVVTDAVGRVVYTNAQQFGSGEQFLTINTADYAPGIYNVKIETTEGTVTERLTVVK